MGPYKLHIEIVEELVNQIYRVLAVADKPIFYSLKKKYVMCQAPKGYCHLKRLADSEALILIVAGTGFAPAKALLESLLPTEKQLHLYWLSNERENFYLQPIIHAWGQRYTNFHYHLIAWSRKESMNELMMRWQSTLSLQSQANVYMAGPFEMMFQLRDALMSLGFNKNQLLSDAFDVVDGK